jgi:hypothetical protein
MNKPAAMHGSAFVKCLLQSIEHKAGIRRPAHPPADDPSGIGINEEGHVHKADQRLRFSTATLRSL